jgi:hypothetical protein
MVIVEEPAPVIDPELKFNVTPLGWPAAARATGELNPPATALVIVTAPLLPPLALTTMTEPALAERTNDCGKAGADGEYSHRSLRRPVTVLVA